MTETIQRLGKYELLEEIGQGAFGTVYKARDTRLHRVVALKVLDPVLLRDPLFVQNLQTEARVTANLQHDHIVRVYDVDQDQGLHFIAMEYVPGGTLAQLLEPQRPLPLKTACAIVRQVAAALDHAHAQKLVHRDVKPSNILLEADPEKGGRAKLSDFGLARAAMTSSVNTQSRVMTGTARYMSPEQARGEATDARSDIYSLGIVAYEMLTGQVPFTKENIFGYIKSHSEEPPPPPARFNPRISQDVQDVVLKALAKDPAQRFQSAGAFAQALDAAAQRPFRPASTEIPAPPLTPTPPVSLPTRPPRPQPPQKGGGGCTTWAVILSAGLMMTLACVVLVVIGALLIPNLLPTATPTQVVVAPTPTPRVVTATPAPTLRLSQTPAPTMPKPSPTQTALPPTVPPSPTPAPTVTPVPPSPTTQPTPTTAGGAAGPRPAYTVETVAGGGAQAGQGRLVVYIRWGDKTAIEDAYIQVYRQKKDLADRWVTDGRIAYAYTDNAGMSSFDLAPGQYIVQADFHGYNWGQAADVMGAADVPVTAGQITKLILSLGRLTVGFQYGDGTPIKDVYTQVYAQKQDLAGHWVTAGRVSYGYTDNAGVVAFDLTPGDYIAQADFAGYNWGDVADVMGRANVRVEPGEVHSLIVALGRLTVGLVDAQGQPRREVYVQVYVQRTDVSGKPTVGDRVLYGYTDNTGAISFDLTAGTYAVSVGDEYTYNVPVQSGRVTVGNGKEFTMK